MCYWDYINDFGITKYIKGSPMQSGAKATGKHSFEVRIHLNQKFLRVACLLIIPQSQSWITQTT